MTDPTQSENPRSAIGGNNPPIWAMLRSISSEENFAATVTEFLNDEYKQWPVTVGELLEEARGLPKVFPDKATRDRAATLIKRLRDTAGKLDAFHTKEKEPYLRGGQAVDQKFYGLIDKLTKRSKNNNPGAADVLNVRLTDFDNAVLAAEQERRRLEAVEAARVARVAQEKAAAEALAAEQARLAAERARKPEIIEQKVEVAREAEQGASAARVDATVVTARAEEAHIATLAKPADIMRDRLDDGTMSTMAQEKYADVVDRDLLDKDALWAFIDHASLEKALRAWARNTDYRKTMPGANVGRRNKSRVL